MTWTRIATGLGAFVLLLFVLVLAVGGPFGVRSVVFVAIALVGLISGGSMLYGRRSHYGAAAARNRDAQAAHDEAADLAADARRATADAARRGERYCPLDPAVAHAATFGHVATNGHAPTQDPASTPPPPLAPQA